MSENDQKLYYFCLKILKVNKVFESDKLGYNHSNAFIEKKIYPRAAANGHPRSAPSAVKNMATNTLPWYHPPSAIMVVIMAKLLGRNAVDALNIPAARTSVPSVNRPAFTPNCRLMALQTVDNRMFHLQAMRQYLPQSRSNFHVAFNWNV